MFAFSQRHVTVCHYNDKRHVTAFRPVSEAAHSWSCDKSYRLYSCISSAGIFVFLVINHSRSVCFQKAAKIFFAV